ncbi:MAG: phosphoenolpyruvate carboxylase [Planctomycetota bacterium]|nr:phosphoenolpyruvate carboxylase [Planctomycetota bacterium]
MTKHSQIRSEPIHFASKDRPLRRDVGWLGALLGELLRDLGPKGLYETVESARLLARRRRKGDAAAGPDLAALLQKLPHERTLEVVRAFGAYFGVVNTAEQVHRMRRRIDYQRSNTTQPASLLASIEEIHRRGTSLEELKEALASVVVEPVFTAHPTETVRRTLLKKEQRLAQQLVDRFLKDSLDPGALATIENGIALEIASAWQTEEQRPGRPTVGEEVEHVLFFLSEVLFRVVPSVHDELEEAIAKVYGERVRMDRPLVRFASWVGGDMDGNPNVGADTMRRALARHLEMALRRYREELRNLHEHLSHSTTRVEIDPQLLARVAEYRVRFAEAFDEVPTRYAEMPYRQLLWLMTARLERKGRGEDGGYGPPEEFRADLSLIADSLRHSGGSRSGLALVERTLRRVDAFGFHLAALDIRQDAETHRRVVGELLEDPDFSSRAPAERTTLIANALRAGLPRVPELTSEETTKSLEVFRALAEAHEHYGPRALGPYIISMAQGPDDALAVLLLARAGGCVADDGSVPIDIAPLFETVDDLEAGPEVLRALCGDATYTDHLAARGRRQVVMLGYSDSNKDGGITASRVTLDRAQEQLVATVQELELELTLFHGRGGSISRGGSKPRAGILAAPPGALSGYARATEQGEIIGDKFGLRGIASRTLAVTLGALLERTAGGDPTCAASEEQRAIADTLSRASREHYRGLVHEDADFPALFQGMTPIDVIERLQIGSRPARRRSMRGVEDLRAIPWVFAWTQSRAVFPGWFGVGTGLNAAIEKHGLEAVRKAARNWPFLATFLADVEMVLAKSDMDIATRYSQLAGDVGARLFPTLREEHARSIDAILLVGEVNELLERDPTLQRSIRLRNPYIDPMSFVQIDLLARWREGDRQDVDLERVLAQTVRGIARGLRNTG